MSERKPNWYTFAWVTWIVAFVVIEVAALFNKKRDSETNPGTLSDHLTRWFSVKTIPGRIVWLVVAGSTFGWILAHIATNQAI